MAKAAWSSVNPSSGSGSGVVNASGHIHTGRLQRTSTLTFKATGAPNKPVTVTQKGKPEFVTVNGVSAAKEGGNVTITGKSNSSKLTLSLGTGSIPVELPTTYLAGGADAESSSDIAGDPGATAEFDFSVTIAVPANDTVEERERILNVVAAGGQSTSATISQAAGDPVLEVSPAAITLEADGTAVAITVTSNTNWTVE